MCVCVCVVVVVRGRDGGGRRGGALRRSGRGGGGGEGESLLLCCSYGGGGGSGCGCRSVAGVRQGLWQGKGETNILAGYRGMRSPFRSTSNRSLPQNTNRRGGK